MGEGREIFRFDDWARFENGDLADEFDATYGRPSASELVRMASLWIVMQNREHSHSVAEVAATFNIPAGRLAEAIRLTEGDYVFLSSDGDDYTKVLIELDGEG